MTFGKFYEVFGKFCCTSHTLHTMHVWPKRGEAVMQRKWRRVYDPNKRRERYAKEQAMWHEQEQLAVAHMMADVDGSLPHRMADEPLKEARREGLPTLAGAGAWPSIYHPAFAAPLWSQWWSETLTSSSHSSWDISSSSSSALMQLNALRCIAHASDACQ